MNNSQRKERIMETNTNVAKARRDNVTGGVVLIGLGGLFLLGQLLDLGWLMLPALAAAFLIAGIVKRESGWFIPAGILGGLSLGIALIEGPWPVATGDAEGGVFMLSFAAGWASIPLLSKLFTNDSHLWALIPGAVMALIGGAVLGGSVFQQALELLPYVWPVALIVGGLLLLLCRRTGGQAIE
jgi:hypothetical protein